MVLRIWFNVMLICLILLGADGGIAGAFTLTIDDFASPDPSGQSATLFNGLAGSAATSIAIQLPTLGDSREIAIEVESALFGGSTMGVEVNGFTTKGRYQLSLTSGVDGFGRIIYDANKAGLNVNLSNYGGIRLVGVVNDMLTPFTLTLETFGGGSSTATKSIILGDLDFLFSSLAGTANLMDIDRITLKIDPFRGGDVSIEAIMTIAKTAVPLPGVLLLLLSSGLP
jgi:hypothetical protein